MIPSTLDSWMKQPRKALLELAILAVAAHSIIAGMVLLSLPAWTLKMVGWGYSGEIFWPRQAGLFLLILGIAYGAAVWYRPMVWLLIGSKGSALVFLMSQALLLEESPRLTIPLGLVDGAMGFVVLGLLWWANHGAASSSVPDCEGCPR